MFGHHPRPVRIQRSASKNVLTLAGHPLIAHTIMAAKASRHIHRVVVTTDDPGIARIARKYGAETPFLRPAALASDTVSMNEVVLHCLEELKRRERYQPDYFALFVPTCPLRTSRQIDEAIELALRHRSEAVISVCPVTTHPYLMKKIENGRLKNAFPGTTIGTSARSATIVSIKRQHLYFANVRFFTKKNMHRLSSVPYLMPARDSVDIDTIDDFLYAEWLMQNASTDERSDGQ